MERRFTGKKPFKRRYGRGRISCVCSIVYVHIYQPVESKGLKLKVKGYEKCTVVVKSWEGGDLMVVVCCF